MSKSHEPIKLYIVLRSITMDLQQKNVFLVRALMKNNPQLSIQQPVYSSEEIEDGSLFLYICNLPLKTHQVIK